MKVNLSNIDFLTLASHYTQLKREARSSGGEYAGPCPRCGGRKRFRVWPDHEKAGKGRWYCRGCEKAGDAGDFLDFVQPGISKADKWTTLKALGATIEDDEAGGQDRLQGKSFTPLRCPEEGRPPAPAWQERARACLVYAQEQLWKDESALAYLIGRGMTPEMIREAGLGYIPQQISDKSERWGLDPEDGPVWIPRGWVIPWELDGGLWRINIRRHPEDLCRAQAAENAKAEAEGRASRKVNKYGGPRGWAGGRPLYRGDRISLTRPVVMVEGEFKAFAILQAAGDWVDVAATGSTTGARAARWIGLLGAAPIVLLAFDNDDNRAGDEAAAWWRRILPNSRRLRPLWADPDQMAQDGLDLREWVQGVLEMAGWEPARLAGLARRAAAPAVDLWRDPYGAEPESWPATVILPDWRGIVTPTKWERRSDGTIRATFESLEEWNACKDAARAAAADLAEAHSQAGPEDAPNRWWTEWRQLSLLAGWDDVGEW